MLLFLAPIALLALPSCSFARKQPQSPYAPTFVKCPDELAVRPASKGLSKQETEWRQKRLGQVITSLGDYLPRTNLTGLDVSAYISKLDPSNAPVVGLAISGGGTQSGVGGLGLWQAFDDRYAPAVAAGTGGLQQCLSYLTGLSGGGFMTVSAIASNNLSSLDTIRESIDFATDYTVGPDKDPNTYFETIFENALAKKAKGFPVSVVDVFGQFFRTYLPKSWSYKKFSDVAGPKQAFSLGAGPMPILVMAEVIPGKSPRIHNIMHPSKPDLGDFRATSYEINPFEFGSWLGGRIQAFFPTKYLGSAMRKGRPQNKKKCVQGFDQFTFVQGSTANAFNFWLIDAFYNIPLFAKRSMESLYPRAQKPSGRIVIPRDQKKNPLVQLVLAATQQFKETVNAALWATWPNPFQGYNKAMSGVNELLLVDGSETGETIPLRPLIVPERKLDFIIAYDASSDADNHWVSGQNFIDTAESASQGNLPFPDLGALTSTAMMNLNLTTFPTFFGCNQSEGPLVLYLPNNPWTMYSNYSYMQSSFTENQFDQMTGNSFNLATYGNGSLLGQDWPACLACAVVRNSLQRIGMNLPDICTQCFLRHCWNGVLDTNEPSGTVNDKQPLLDPSLTYEEWNKTWYAT